MPQNYFRCRGCGVLALITYKAADVDSVDWPPRCTRDLSPWGLLPVCGIEMELAPQPGDFTMDARSDGGTNKSFQKFTVDVDGRPTEIDSLHKLRMVERDSEQRYRNGEGEPLRFRMWNQTASNRDVNSFGTAGTIGEGTVQRAYDSGTPAPKSPKVSIRKHGETKPRIPLGPGLSRARSPLKG